MHIALNAQLISDAASYRGAGVNNYARQLLRALGELTETGVTDLRFTAFVHAQAFGAPGIDLAQTPLPLERPIARILWEQTLLPLHLRAGKFDLVHGLVNVLPLATRTPGVVTVHDLSFVRTPERLPALKRAYLTRLCAMSVARARRVIAVSRQTADDLVACFATPRAKITVVPNGVAPEYAPRDPYAVEEFRRRRDLPARYLFYVGTLEPRKNLERLIRAFARWQRQAADGAERVELVLGGGKGWYYDTIFAEVARLGLTNQVHFPGFIPTPELPYWYQAAEAFVYPSVFEGFGLPVLEAMACGVPVLCSQAPSLLDVAGSAALTFPAADEDALVHSLHLVLGQPALQRELSRRGLARSAQFSWRRCAAATLAVYAEASSLRSPAQP